MAQPQALLLIDTAVIGYEQIAAAAQPTTTVVLFDRHVDTFQTLKDKIAAATTTAAQIGIIHHGDARAPYYTLLETQATPAIVTTVETDDPTLTSWAELKDFYNWLKDRGATTIDLISCALYANPGWVYVIQTLEQQLELDFRASSNNTGNVASGGDWIQESDGVNIQTLYFTSDIEEYVGLFANFSRYSKSSQMVCAPNTLISGVYVNGARTTNGQITSANPSEYMVKRDPFQCTVNAIGNATYGGNSGSAFAAGSGIASIATLSGAVTALKYNGSIYVWGFSPEGNNTTAQTNLGGGSAAAIVFGNAFAFAALKTDKTVRVWGNTTYGGDNTQATNMGSDINIVSSTNSAFALIYGNQNANAWGDSSAGGSGDAAQPGSIGGANVAIGSTGTAFAVLKSNGTFRSWGNRLNGGSNQQAIDAGDGYTTLVSNVFAFAAIRGNGTAYSWGNSAQGGNYLDAQGAGNDVIAIASTERAFAALKSNGRVYAWGNASYGGDNNSTGAQNASGIVAIASSNGAFAALSSTGTIYAWGDTAKGGDNAVAQGLGSGFIALTSSYGAFAALKSDGTVRAWGDSLYGGDASALSTANSGIVSISASYGAFCALRANGTVVSWGNGGYGAASVATTSALGSGFVSVAATDYAFILMKANPIPTTASAAASSGFVGNFIATSNDTQLNISLGLRAGIQSSTGTTKVTNMWEFINGMRYRFRVSTLTIPAANFTTFQNTISSGAGYLNTSKDVIQFFPTIESTFNSYATVDITSMVTDNSQYVCIELPINIPTYLYDYGAYAGALFYDGTNVYNNSSATGSPITPGTILYFYTKTFTRTAIGGGLIASAGPIWDPLPGTPVFTPRPLVSSGTITYFWSADPLVYTYTVTLTGPGGSIQQVVTTNSTTFTSLSDGTTYSATMYGTDYYNRTTSTVTFRSVQPGSRPGAITTANFSKVGNSLQVTWTAPSNGGSELQGYSIRSTLKQKATTFCVEPWKTIYITTPIPAGTYVFQICAVNAAGYGPVQQSAPLLF